MGQIVFWVNLPIKNERKSILKDVFFTFSDDATDYYNLCPPKKMVYYFVAISIEKNDHKKIQIPKNEGIWEEKRGGFGLRMVKQSMGKHISEPMIKYFEPAYVWFNLVGRPQKSINTKYLFTYVQPM